MSDNMNKFPYSIDKIEKTFLSGIDSVEAWNSFQQFLLSLGAELLEKKTDDTYVPGHGVSGAVRQYSQIEEYKMPEGKIVGLIFVNQYATRFNHNNIKAYRYTY